MKRLVLFLAAAVMVSTVLAGFKYEGQWGKWGTGNGEFIEPASVAIAPNGRVYVAEYEGNRVQYFTRTGSFLGKWDVASADGLALAPNGNVYTGGCGSDRVRYFTRNGSLLGTWKHPGGLQSSGGDVAPNGDVYVSVGSYEFDGVCYYTPTGLLLGSWGASVGRVAVAPGGNVYLHYSDEVRYFSPTGSYLGEWVTNEGGGGIDVAPNGDVFVAESGDRIFYYTATGSLLGSWGGEGTGPGQFLGPSDVAVSLDGKRVYVADRFNHRIQYFVEDTAVVPASLGKVKALFGKGGDK